MSRYQDWKEAIRRLVSGEITREVQREREQKESYERLRRTSEAVLQSVMAEKLGDMFRAASLRPAGGDQFYAEVVYEYVIGGGGSSGMCHAGRTVWDHELKDRNDRDKFMDRMVGTILSDICFRENLYKGEAGQ